MTFIIVVLLGAGVIFVASSLDNTPIIQTFQKIVSGGTIDWSGSGANTQIGISGATGTGPGGAPCTLKAGGSLTDIDNFCRCTSGYPSMDAQPIITDDGSAKYESYRACLAQHAS